MFSARAYALAAALLLVPTGWGLAQDAFDTLESMWDDPEDAVEYSSEVSAWVENVTFADPPAEYEYPPWNLTGEQLVEGHTTFVTIERTPVQKIREGYLNITGYLQCAVVFNETHRFAFGFVPVPTQINEAGVDCGDGARVVISPGLSATSSAGPYAPTGDWIELETPDGQTAYAEEFVFTANTVLPDGTLDAREYYAWATPVFPPWVHHDGTVKNFWMPLPLDRLEAMGVTDFRVDLERQL